MVEIKHLKGTRDYDPKKAKIFFKIIEKANEIFPLYGYDPLDTSTLERWETLISKDVNAGEEIKNQTYNFIDKGGKHIGLRFDLTVSLIRYVVENKNIVLPFKRYQIGKVYRYEEAKRSRYREFYQLDLDVIGGKSFLYDAELLKIGNEFLESIGIKNYKILVNNRKIAEKFLKDVLKIKNKYIERGLRIIDKIDKISYEEFMEELKQISETRIEDSIYENIKNEFNNLNHYLNAFKLEGEEIEEFDRSLKEMDVKNCYYSMKIVRGLGYYTSNVFETFIVNAPLLGSIASGGRYDNVFDKIIQQHLPSVGFSFGVDRIIDHLSKELEEEKDVIYIAYTNKNMLRQSIEIREKLKKMNLKTYITYDSKNLTNQIKHADKLRIKHLLIIGEKDLSKGEITYRNLESGEEKKIKISELKVLKNVVSRN